MLGSGVEIGGTAGSTSSASGMASEFVPGMTISKGYFETASVKIDKNADFDNIFAFFSSGVSFFSFSLFSTGFLFTKTEVNA